MSVYNVLSQEQGIQQKWDIIYSTHGTMNLDEIIGSLYIHKDKVDPKKIKKAEKLYDTVSNIVNKYLNDRERLIFHIYINLGKNIAEIKKICNFGCWFTAQAHVLRMFKLVKIYYRYEIMDKEKIQKIINKNFNNKEKRIIELLQLRIPYPEISKTIGCYYRKTYYDCQDILKRLETLLPEYHKFIMDLRKFKRLNDFDIKIVEQE